jgi:hypothetical protein
MNNSKNTNLKQWFTFTFNDGRTDLVYVCYNNHYFQGWFEKHGYKEFENSISHTDFKLFLHAINSSGNMIPDEFTKHFPKKYIKNYTLWDSVKNKRWGNVDKYIKHTKKQMIYLFDKLYDLNEYLENVDYGYLKYNIYYDVNHDINHVYGKEDEPFHKTD